MPERHGKRDHPPRARIGGRQRRLGPERSRAVEMIFDLILEIRREGVTVLMVEQNAYAALEMCDRAYLLENGRIVKDGTAADMLADPAIRRAYLGG